MVTTDKMAMIGDGDSILAFRAGGIDCYSTQGADVKELIKKTAKQYRIIFITEKVAKEYEEILSAYVSEPYPIFLAVPDKGGSNGYGREKMKKSMDKALGVDILFSNNND